MLERCVRSKTRFESALQLEWLFVAYFYFEKTKTTYSPRSLAILTIIAAFPEGGTEFRSAIPDKSEGGGEEESDETCFSLPRSAYF